MMFAEIKKIIFRNKQNIQWREVEEYLKSYIGKMFKVMVNGDEISITSDFPDEYSGSKYTKKLRGALAKAKANASQVIGEMIENAENRRWVENKDAKHAKDANGGWYRYDTGFSLPVENNGEKYNNYYEATLIVRIKDGRLYLYDIINIKKRSE